MARKVLHTVLAGASGLLLFFQNCSPVNFDSSVGPHGKAGTDVVAAPPPMMPGDNDGGWGGGPQDPNDPLFPDTPSNPSEPPPADSIPPYVGPPTYPGTDTPIFEEETEYDGGGNPIVFHCKPTEGLVTPNQPLPLTKNGSMKFVQNSGSVLFEGYNKLGVSLSRFNHLEIDNTNVITDFKFLTALTSITKAYSIKASPSFLVGHAFVFNANEMPKGPKFIRSVITTINAKTVGDLSFVYTDELCVTAQKLGKITFVRTSGIPGGTQDPNAFKMRITGMNENNQLTAMDKIKFLNASMSLNNVKVPSVEFVNGRVILRNSVVGDIKFGNMELTLINSKITGKIQFTRGKLWKDSASSIPSSTGSLQVINIP